MNTPILIVSSWGTACGIADHSRHLIDACTSPEWQFEPRADFLDPAACFFGWRDWPITILNYHRGLHSRWTIDQVKKLKERSKVVVIFHDTRGEAEPDELQLDLHAFADAFIVHEPVLRLPNAIYLRQGVPAAESPLILNRTVAVPPDTSTDLGRAVGQAPILGTAGFNFPWKNYDRLAEITSRAGWGLMILSNNATQADIERWQQVNPNLLVVTGFLPAPSIVHYLSACDATAFMYQCANTGTSGAIRLGIAARKPVLAEASCRQFRDLQDLRKPQTTEAEVNEAAIRFVHLDDLYVKLATLPISDRPDPAVVAVATRDAWSWLGLKYQAIFRSL